jgi:hypothetical protein
MVSLQGSCHCGKIVITLDGDPVEATECNCSICRRTGALWTYALSTTVTVSGEGVSYIQGDRSLEMMHCHTCGVVTHWTSLDPNYQRMGINLRLFDPALLEKLPRKFVDGASW